MKTEFLSWHSGNETMSCGVGCRHGSDLTLLWLWYRLAATAPIRPLAWEPPYATGTALKEKQNLGAHPRSDSHTWSAIPEGLGMESERESA